MQTGILLINLGTPDSPNKSDVRKYLKEFLSDPRVIDISALSRWILVNLFILPFRPKKSAAAYQEIWTDLGSPLLVYTAQLTQYLQEKIGKHAKVTFAMRYGSPSIASAIKELSACEKIIVLPLFPQYSSAATGSAIAKVLECYSREIGIPSLQIIHNFYDQPWFIDPYAAVINNHLQKFDADFILFSYHGLPQRQIDKCYSAYSTHHFCYQTQCLATTTALAKKLNLASTQFTTSFQSRLGRTPWIKPYTDEILQQLFNNGVKRLAVVCPSFIVDCLETLEEIAMRAKEQWLALGGESFLQIPCLNTNPEWIDALAHYLCSFSECEIP